MSSVICGARIGNASRNNSRCDRTTRSTSSLASASTIETMRVGRQPSRRAAGHAIRSYQPNCRSRPPRSSILVLISMINNVPVRVLNASMSIQPCDRPWMTSTSRAVVQPKTAILRSTYAEHRAWTASRRCGPAGKMGGRKRISVSRPSASAIRSTSRSDGFALPRSIIAKYRTVIPTRSASACLLTSRDSRVSTQARPNEMRSAPMRRLHQTALVWDLSGRRRNW